MEAGREMHRLESMRSDMTISSADRKAAVEVIRRTAELILQQSFLEDEARAESDAGQVCEPLSPSRRATPMPQDLEAKVAIVKQVSGLAPTLEEGEEEP